MGQERELEDDRDEDTREGMELSVAMPASQAFGLRV
jgi:hypothetical protein